MSKPLLRTAHVHTLARALAHPIRVEIIQTMGEDQWSPVALHHALPHRALGTLAYHVRELEKAGLLKRDGRAQRRGAVEHFYRVEPRAQRLVAALLREFAEADS